MRRPKKITIGELEEAVMPESVHQKAEQLDASVQNMLKRSEDVSVPLSVLEQLQKTLEEQKAQIESLQANQDILTKAANKAKLERHTPKKGVGLNIDIGIYTRDGSDRVITSWENLPKDYVKFTKGDEKEDQIMRINLEDGVTIDMPYTEFHGSRIKVPVEVDKEKSTWEYADDGRRLPVPKIAVFTYNDKEYSIEKTFFNP